MGELFDLFNASHTDDREVARTEIEYFGKDFKHSNKEDAFFCIECDYNSDGVMLDSRYELI